ncbi:hypothetical protein PM030_05290 [Halorubrum ezzemoulense]|uniref:hypothetical protein n=1 Tax=Halorubrum ezzemoulense TaxID=337243 RepID=UPI00232A9935|nr:hypothetical protein [Halorubrum ezzemoulense]MDB2281283.1 hypothetical protein [Halorubrum ezzemoulense]
MDIRAVIVSILIGLITAAIGELLGISERISPVDTGILNNILVRGTVVFVILALVIYVLLSLMIKRRDKLRSENAPVVFTAKQRPQKIIDKIKIKKFGVKWEGLYGTRRDLPTSGVDDAYVYVDGPYCPKDDTKLKSRTVPKWFVFEENTWVCPHCGSSHSRPTTHYLDEDSVVEDELERIFQQRHD